MVNFIETNWIFVASFIVVGLLAKFLNFFDYFILVTLAFMVGKIVEIQNYHLGK